MPRVLLAFLLCALAALTGVAQRGDRVENVAAARTVAAIAVTPGDRDIDAAAPTPEDAGEGDSTDEPEDPERDEESLDHEVTIPEEPIAVAAPPVRRGSLAFAVFGAPPEVHLEAPRVPPRA